VVSGQPNFQLVIAALVSENHTSLNHIYTSVTKCVSPISYFSTKYNETGDLPEKEKKEEVR
jgi:hypothetical protein